MITLADPLPDDLETAHQLIRELLKTLGPADPSQREAPAPARTTPPPALRSRRASGSTRPNSCSSPGRSWRRPSPRRHPLRIRSRPRPRRPLRVRPRRRATAASRCRRACPAEPVLHDVPPEQRTCPDCGAERTCIGQEVREQLEYIPASADRARTHPPQVCLPGLRGQRRDRRAAPRADREGPARPGTDGSRRHQQICRSLAALSPRRHPRALRRRVLPVDDVRLDGRRSPSLLEPIVKLMLKQDPHLPGRPERRHAGAGAGSRRQRDQDRPALGLHRRPRPSLCRLSLHAGPQCRRAGGDLQGLRGLSPGRRRFGLRRPVQVGQDHRGRVHDARAAKVLRGPDQRSAAVASGAGMDQLALRRRKRREEARDRGLRGVRRLTAPSCETSDRGRSSTSFTPGWKPSSPRFCPRVRSAKRSSMPGTIGRPSSVR